MPLIRSISGLRATIEDSLKPEIVENYCRAFARILPAGDIIIGRDGRPSGDKIEKIVAETLSKSGRKVILLGIVPTPTVQLVVESLKSAAGGIAVTASHNPAQWNGLKFINQEGIFLSADENMELWDVLDKNEFLPYSDSESIIPQIIQFEEPEKFHIDSILNLYLFQNGSLREKISERKFRAVVDAVNASGSTIVPQLLSELGCEPVELYCAKNGIFPHTPEPLPEYLDDLAKAVVWNRADIGIAVDPDADRLVLIDETGAPIGEENTIVLSVKAALKLIATNDVNGLSVVVNHSTTAGVEAIASVYGAKVFRSSVGEINVVKKMKETGALIGGEGSGGVILSMCHYGRDSLVGIALILALLADSGKTLSEMCSSLPKLMMVKTKQAFSGSIDYILKKIVKEFSQAEIIYEDGMKVIFDDSWVQIRASNTEPIIRIIAEAPEKEQAEQLISRIQKLL